MPALENIRHEAFCQHIVAGAKFGQTQGTAHLKAGYRTSGHAAEVGASRLLKNADIQARIAELVTPAAAKRRVDVSAKALIDKSESLIERGLATDQLNAVGKGIELQGKLGGALIDRVEVGGPGAFAHLQSLEDAARFCLDSYTIDVALIRTVSCAGAASTSSVFSDSASVSSCQK